VRFVEIVSYRESHGGEIRREPFRAQFVGKRLSDPLVLSRDVRNIAGATISCRALTDGVHDVLAILTAALPVAAPATPPRAGQAPLAGTQAHAAAGEIVTRVRLAMGTELEIRAMEGEASHAEQAIALAFAEVERLEALWSTWRPESELSRLNAAAGGAPLRMSDETLELLQRAQQYSRESEGAFNVLAGPSIELWRRAAKSGAAPTPAELESACALAANDVLELDLAAKTARLARAGALVDVGGIGKGAALDRAARVLEASGVHVALLNFGGQILALDPPPGRSGWKVEVRDPRGGETALSVLELARASLSTSADDQRGLSVGGRPVSHIVDPRNGRPACGIASATVVLGDGTAADAWSKVVFVLGPDAAAALREREGLATLVLSDAGELRASASFAKFTAAAAQTR
jgi:thiamine biosynthesis lipoprotein